MSKKNKRAVVPQETLDRARAEMRGELTASPSAPVTVGNNTTARTSEASTVTGTVSGTVRSVKPGTTLAARRNPTVEELTREYGYVNHDLRSLGLLAVSLMGLIVVASIIINAVAG